MDEHAHESSLNERLKLLEATIAGRITALEEKIAQAMAAEEVIRRAHQAAPPPVTKPRQPAHKRPNPQGLHVVRGVATAGGGALAWVLRSRAHKMATLGLMAAIAAGAGGPSVITGTLPAGVPPRAHHTAPSFVSPARPRRRASGSAAAPGASPSSRPSAMGSGRRPEDEPQPSPAGVVPFPSPSGSPLCAQLTDKACDHNKNCVCPSDGDGDGDGDADDVLALAA